LPDALPIPRAAASMRAWSVATITRSAREACARSAVRTTIGLPPMSSRGLSGRRVDDSRAGTTAMKLMPQEGAYRFARFRGLQDREAEGEILRSEEHTPELQS